MSLLRASLLLACSLVSCADPPAAHAPPRSTPTVAVKAEAAPATSELVPVHADDPIRGPKTARVTIVTFSDFQCPFCAKVEPTMKALADKYGESLRIVWKDWPLKFHKFAREAAVVGRAVYLARGQEAFFRYHDIVFERQSELSSATILEWAAEAGATPSDIDARRSEAEAKIDASTEEAARLGLDATPAFVIDGVRITGAKSLASFEAIVDAHLEEAKALEQKGTPPDAIYDALVRAHWVEPGAPSEDDLDSLVDKTVWRVDLAGAPTRGPADAPVTIVEFADFECPFCKKNAATLQALDKAHPGKLRFAFKHAPLPFHKRALPAANFAIEARAEGGDAAFFRAHDALFATGVSDDDLQRIAKDLGLDPKKTADAVANETGADVIDRDRDQGTDLEVKGTPCTFVNGRKIEGAMPLSVFEKIVAEELAKAEAKVQSGVAASKVYEETIKGGKGGPVALDLPKTAPKKGSGPVVLQVFADFECGFCKRLERVDPDDADGRTGALAKIEKRYGDRLTIVWRDYPLPFHTHARAAATLARIAFADKGAATFWKVHDALFAAQSLDDATLEAIAKKHGVDWKKVKKAIDGSAWPASIDGDVAAGTVAGVTGTPTVFVDGRPIVGAQGEPVFVRAIDRALRARGIDPTSKKK